MTVADVNSESRIISLRVAHTFDLSTLGRGSLVYIVSSGQPELHNNETLL